MYYVNVKNFTLSEMTRSETAEKAGLENVPSEEQMVNIVQMMMALQRMRNELERPIKVTSGFRSQRLNKEVGGAIGSRHLRGMAADITIPGVSFPELMRTLTYLVREEVITRVILESLNGRKWLHVEVGAEVSEGGVAILRMDGGAVMRHMWYWESMGELEKEMRDWFDSSEW